MPHCLCYPFAIIAHYEQINFDLKSLIKNPRRYESDAYATDKLDWNKPLDKIEGLTHYDVLHSLETFGDVFGMGLLIKVALTSS